MTKLIVGCGYLGSRVARLWLERGERVFATTRGRVDELKQLGVEPIVCDVVAAASLAPLAGLPRPLTLLHCVGMDRSSGQGMREVYVNGLANLLAACGPVDRFLHVSSSGVYGQVDGSLLDETAATEPIEESGKIVLAAEELLAATLPDAIVLRFAGIYGPGRILRRQGIEAGSPIVGDADKWLNLIHVDDGAKAVIAAEGSGTPGAIYNVSDGCPVKRRDFYTYVAALLKAPTPVFEPVPEGQPAPPHEATNRRIDNHRLRQQLCLSFDFPDFWEGLKAALGNS